MKRIGFIGTENSHTDHFIRFLNQEVRHPGFCAAALAGGRTERNLSLARSGGIELIVNEPTDLIGLVDAAIISTRDGAKHREQAEPLLAAGIPVLVDKPLATTIEDADAILAAAETSGTLVYSASALRFVPEIAEMKRLSAREGPMRHLHIAGSGDVDSPYSGLFFYGIHHVEAALELLGNPPVDDVEVSVFRREDTTVATLAVAETPITLTFVAPREAEQLGFHATAVFGQSTHAVPLTLGPDYNAPALANFVGAVASGKAPTSAADMRAPITVLAAIVERLR